MYVYHSVGKIFKNTFCHYLDKKVTLSQILSHDTYRTPPHTSTHRLPNSHHPPDPTKLSRLCCVCVGGVNWTVALNVQILSVGATVLSRRDYSVHTADAGATVLSALATAV